jgi:hypothetical protein
MHPKALLLIFIPYQNLNAFGLPSACLRIVLIIPFVYCLNALYILP